MAEELTREMFAAHLGDTFRLTLESGDSMDLELIEAEPGKSPTKREGRAPFTLVFRGRPDMVLPQRMYDLSHEKIGDLSLFLVPIGPDEQGMQYEAVFN
jgi:hypothetical protein